MTTGHTKRIAVDDLTIGMYLVGVDQSWLHSPFLFQRRRIGSQDDIARLKAYGIRHVTIDPSRGLDFVATAQDTPDAGDTEEGSLPVPRSAPAASSVLEPPRPAATPRPDFTLVRAVHTEAVAAVQSLFEGVQTGRPINSGVAKEVVHTLLSTVLQHHNALAHLIHMRQFDTHLYEHAINVCIFALMLGTVEALDEGRLECLGLGALLHDVGQICLPRNLVRKPTPYTPQEQRLMQAHPQLGATILARVPHMPAAVCQIVVQHHERLDGSGYPDALRGDAVLPLSQIVAIADVYESMLGPREARPPLLPAQALKELYRHGRAQQLDLGLVEKMVRCLGLYPVGSLVELNTGERGIVTAVNPSDALRPSVTVLWNAVQQRYAPPLLVHLSLPNTEEPRVICQVLDPVAEGYDLVMTLEASTQA